MHINAEFGQLFYSLTEVVNSVIYLCTRNNMVDL